jgi:hypothetical protein
MDSGYMPGMSNDCGKLICCRADSGLPKVDAEISGPWGDYLCDAPEKLIKSMFYYIT